MSRSGTTSMGHGLQTLVHLESSLNIQRTVSVDPRKNTTFVFSCCLQKDALGLKHYIFLPIFKARSLVWERTTSLSFFELFEDLTHFARLQRAKRKRNLELVSRVYHSAESALSENIRNNNKRHFNNKKVFANIH